MAYSFIHVVYVPTKHIAYFLSSFLCLFSLFPYLYVGVPWPWAVRFRWASMDSTTTPALESASFYLFYAFSSFTFHVSYYGTCMPVSLGHCIYIMFLTMGVFTTSWWVVNQPIVMVIFLYAFYILMFILYPTIWWGETLRFTLILCFICFIICRTMFPCLV